MNSWLCTFCDKYFADCKNQYRNVKQGEIFKVKIFKGAQKSINP